MYSETGKLHLTHPEGTAGSVYAPGNQLQIIASASGQQLNKRIDPLIDPKEF